MKRIALTLAFSLAGVAALTAIPSVHSSYEDGWMCMGIGASLSIPDWRLAPMFEFEVGGPQQIGCSIQMMFGNRFLATGGILYILDPAPGSIVGVPIILRGGILDIGKGRIDLGLSLSSGLRFYALPVGPISDENGGMHVTADAEATAYWNFRKFTFSMEAYPGIIFSLVDSGTVYYY